MDIVNIKEPLCSFIILNGPLDIQMQETEQIYYEVPWHWANKTVCPCADR